MASQHSVSNGARADGIEFRTLWILSTAHITKENADGKLGPNHNGEWPVRSTEECATNIYVSEDDEDDHQLDPHLQAIFKYAREHGVCELRFDESGPVCDLFPNGGDNHGFLDPMNPEQTPATETPSP